MTGEYDLEPLMIVTDSLVMLSNLQDIMFSRNAIMSNERDYSNHLVLASLEFRKRLALANIISTLLNAAF